MQSCHWKLSDLKGKSASEFCWLTLEGKLRSIEMWSQGHTHQGDMLVNNHLNLDSVIINAVHSRWWDQKGMARFLLLAACWEVAYEEKDARKCLWRAFQGTLSVLPFPVCSSGPAAWVDHCRARHHCTVEGLEDPFLCIWMKAKYIYIHIWKPIYIYIYSPQMMCIGVPLDWCDCGFPGFRWHVQVEEGSATRILVVILTLVQLFFFLSGRGDGVHVLCVSVCCCCTP